MSVALRYVAVASACGCGTAQTSAPLAAPVVALTVAPAVASAPEALTQQRRSSFPGQGAVVRHASVDIAASQPTGAPAATVWRASPGVPADGLVASAGPREHADAAAPDRVAAGPRRSTSLSRASLASQGPRRSTSMSRSSFASQRKLSFDVPQTPEFQWQRDPVAPPPLYCYALPPGRARTGTSLSGGSLASPRGSSLGMPLTPDYQWCYDPAAPLLFALPQQAPPVVHWVQQPALQLQPPRQGAPAPPPPGASGPPAAPRPPAAQRGRGGQPAPAAAPAAAWSGAWAAAPARAGATTVMLRNIPVTYERERLLADLDRRGFRGAYDFLYLPMDFQTGNNVGYAFVNFTSEAEVVRFRAAYQGLQLSADRSNKICAVCDAQKQGLHQNVEHYRNSPVMGMEERYHPLLFEKGVRQPFPGPTKVLKQVRQRATKATG